MTPETDVKDTLATRSASGGPVDITAASIKKRNSSNNNRTAATTNAIELSENFFISTKRKHNVKIQVKLSEEGIYLRRETEQDDHITEQHIRLQDIIGSRCGPRLKKRTRGGLSSCKCAPLTNDAEEEQKQVALTTAKDTSAYLYIYAYIKQEKPSLRRNRTVRILRFRSHARYEDNLRSAERWHHAIDIYKRGMGSKPLLILLNPKSGSGKGRELFQKQVVPVLKEAEMQYDLQVTTHANFARELVRTRKDLLERYCGIVVASGDGLFYEVLNGLMERVDWRVISRELPIGIIPCGSGNGLAKSIAHVYNEPYEPKPILHATLTCVTGKSAPMDIVHIELECDGQQTEMYSFLSVGWGLIADVDIESERLRSIGAQRFTIWSIRRLISLRTYKGKLSYLPWRKEQPTHTVEIHDSVPVNSSRSEISSGQLDPPLVQEFHDISEESENIHQTDDDDGEFVDAISLDRTSFRPHIDSWHSATSRRTAYYSLTGQSMRSHRSILSRIEAANAELEVCSPVSTIPPLSMPLPSAEWHTEEGDYVMVHAAYTTHLATDCLFAPESKLNDGIIYLVIIRSGVSRSQLLQFLLGLSSGTHLPAEPNQFIQVVPVRAFRIEPHGKDGIITVDGERIDYGPIQAEIFPGVIKVMVPDTK